jgi:hypothetical protein
MALLLCFQESSLPADGLVLFRENERHKSASSAPSRLVAERPFIKSDSSPVPSDRKPNKLNKLSSEILDYFVCFGLHFYQSIGL